MKAIAVVLNIRFFGMLVALSYILSILGVWIYFVFQGHTYFYAGEPNVYVRNIEWFMGFTAVYILSCELKGHFKIKRTYDLNQREV